MKYYYFAASLPMLAPEELPPMSFKHFRVLCGEHLAASDLRALDALTAEDAAGESDRPFAREWLARERTIRNAVAVARAQRLRVDPAPFLREPVEYAADIQRGVAEALAKETPLDRESALDRLRWRLIEEITGYDEFSGRALLAYGLKLRIAEHWASLDSDEGRSQFDALVSRDARASRSEG